MQALQRILCALAHTTITRELPLILDLSRRPEFRSAGKRGFSSGPAMHAVPGMASHMARALEACNQHSVWFVQD